MFRVTIILFEYLILLFALYHYNRKAIIAPSFSFVICFIPQILLLLVYADSWKIDLADGTFAIYTIGPLVFAFGAVVSDLLTGEYKKRTKRNFNNKAIINKIKPTNVAIPSIYIRAFLIIEIVVFLLTVLFLIRNYSGSTMASVIFSYRLASRLTNNEIPIPGLLRAARTLCFTMNYFFIYVLADSIISKDKTNRIHLILIVIAGALNYVILGARGGAVQLIVALLLQVYFLYLHKIHWKSRIEIKNIFRIILIVAVLFPLFRMSANWLGRDSTSYTASDYLAMYMSAEVSNLDTFIKQGSFGSSISNNQTFCYIINDIAKFFNAENNWVHQLDNPFRRLNGFNMGNVSTVYYAPLYDYGYFGVFIYILSMGILCELLYIKAKKSIRDGHISVFVVAYSYVFYTIIFSFFSSKFSEMLFNPVFIKMCITWYILYWLIDKKRIKLKLK